MRKPLFVIFLIIYSANFSKAQVYTNKVVGEKNESYIDSLKSIEYPYALPILGAKAAARGYDLPYSAGLGVNYLWQKSASWPAGHNSLEACNIVLVYKNPDL